MNTVRSVGYGWGVLVAAGGGAYYFAKRSINADRAERAAAEEQRRQEYQRLQYAAPPPPRKYDGPASPSQEASQEVGPPADPKDQPIYETSKPFRSKKGDRFS